MKLDWVVELVLQDDDLHVHGLGNLDVRRIVSTATPEVTGTLLNYCFRV